MEVEVIERLEDASLTEDQVPEELWLNRRVVLAAISQGGTAIRKASEELRSDREVLREAENYGTGNPLKFAPEEIRAASLLLDGLKGQQVFHSMMFKGLYEEAGQRFSHRG